MRLALLLALAAPLLLAPPAAAQTAADSGAAPDLRPQIAAAAVEPGAVDLDGRLDEAAWGGAAVASGFVQQRPTPGAAPSEPTEARVLYDAKAVYVGMRMVDSRPAQIDARLGRRDAFLETDWATVMIDSYDDDRTAFMFRVNPAGVQVDRLLFDDVNEDQSWDAVWDVATSRDEGGWTAEFRIPLSQLRFAGGAAVQTWGLNVQRVHFRTGETSLWAPVLPSDPGYVSRFGTLADLRGLAPPRQLEVVPYLAASVERAPGDAADPFFRATEATPRVGADVKYGITSDLTLTATVNPDFGQVEADPAQVNLGGFELFFQERRPFFVEGTDVFSLRPRRFFSNNRPNLLYTRRIGRAPQRRQFVPASVSDAATDGGAVYTDAPQQSTILGAAKLSGRVGRFSVGVLNATTGNEYGRYQAFDGAGGAVGGDDRVLVEPLANYLVGRARGTFGQTIAGGLLTSVVRDTGDPALGALLPTMATVAGADVEHRLGDEWLVNGQLAGSLVTGSADAVARVQRAFPRLYQRPDADHLSLDPAARSLAGFTGEVNVLKAGGEHWLGGLHAGATSPGFDANELGFQSRADFANLGLVVVYQDNEPGGGLNRWNANAFLGLGGTFGGDRTATFGGLEGSFQTKGFWGANLNSFVGARTDDDRLTRGGPLATSPAAAEGSVYAYSDDRRPVAVSGFVYGFRDELGGWRLSVDPEVEVRPAPAVSFEVGPSVSVGRNARQYVTAFDEPAAAATFGRRYVFARLDQATLSLQARLNWTFTPDLTLQLYARPFVSTGRYSRVQTLGEPGQLRLPVFGEDAGGAAAENGDGSITVTPGDGGAAFDVAENFTSRALQGNAVLRWEYRPGSALFLVWQQQRSGFEPDGALRFGRDVGGVFSDPVANVFLLKLSYWLGG
ncbi:DUF5916 domain-containing protein [Rubrivirga sp. S365]|uniref:DUF5916 domain-containing protein n=1 Tax=Rubrivirga litoralis TaxID=3075598 RepID=A0ABU3BNC9_9BACT|nr:MULTISPECIES: DUF5916 domain-containing protein [unclassified Rubrivirga]MDT0630726.1 DUF5916 domain-containing protein [Rubrivirga sp. F394]MDT7856396.1 DUF5916 domain-containing protein [Rubrivirga sp. S365]